MESLSVSHTGSAAFMRIIFSFQKARLSSRREHTVPGSPDEPQEIYSAVQMSLEVPQQASRPPSKPGSVTYQMHPGPELGPGQTPCTGFPACLWPHLVPFESSEATFLRHGEECGGDSVLDAALDPQPDVGGFPSVAALSPADTLTPASLLVTTWLMRSQSPAAL